MAPPSNLKSKIHYPKSSYDVVIIGGGLSGLAAAVELALNGADVALCEQAPKLGGRCYSYVNETTGDVVDNGQHILIGAYHNTLRYLEVIGTRHFLKAQSKLKLPLFHPARGLVAFEVSSLPQPLGVTSGMLRYKHLSLNDRQKVLKVWFDLNNWNETLEKKLSLLTVEQWLKSLHQSEEARKALWYPLAISMMNELPERASALLFARSIRAAFFGKKSDSTILIPIIGQSELYVHSAVALLNEKGVHISLNTQVESIIAEDSKIVGVRLNNGKNIKAEYVVGAVPWFSLPKLIPPAWKKEKPFLHLNQFHSSPILSIHLWFDKEFMADDFVGIADRSIQWVFNKRRILKGGGKTHSYLSVVISAAYNVVNFSRKRLVELALKDLREAYPESRNASLVHAVVVKEKRATFSPTNETEPLRPNAETPIKNFFLAGDWTNTGLPATIEGAVMSGFHAAKLISS
ncbi:MAG: FAD-dependent oxidoreductase [Ignavibacteriae bacterium]|nr:FAD-dependent oxidoreductase [Ignavibacteriota bacterium]